MAQNISLLGATYSAVPAVQLPKQGGGTARFDDCSVVTATASDVASGKVFVASDGAITTGTASVGADIPVFAVTMTAEYVPTAISCNKTYSQITAVMPDEMSGYVQFSTPSETWGCPSAARYDDYYSPTCIIWRIMNSGGMPDYEFTMYPNGTITLPGDANFSEDLQVTQNGVYFPSDSLHRINRVSVAVPPSGVICPVFSRVFDGDNYTITCNMTYQEVYNFLTAGPAYTYEGIYRYTETSQSQIMYEESYGLSGAAYSGLGQIIYSSCEGDGIPRFSLMYYSDGTISYLPKVPSQVDNEVLTTNDIHTAETASGSRGFWREVTVEVPTSGMNWQVNHSMYRIGNTSYVDTNLALTVKKAGTYTVRWSAFRSNTSNSYVNGTQLRKNGTVVGSNFESWTNSYQQAPAVTGLALAKDDVLTIYARSRSASYYVCVSELLIEQTS